MLELVASNCHGPQDMTATFSHTSNLVFARLGALLLVLCSSVLILALIYSSFNLPQIHDVCRRVSYEISSSSWSLILDSFANMLEYLLNKADSSANAAKITSMMDCLETIRLVFEHVLRVAPSHFGPIHFYGMIVLLLYLHSIK
jgi:hypothetical protein